MSGIVRQISGELSQGTGKGKAFVSKLNSALSPSAIAKAKPKTQECKKKKYAN